MATSFAPGHFKFQEEEERGNLTPNWGRTTDEDYFLTTTEGEGAIITIEMDCLLLYVVITFQLLPFIIAVTAEQRSKRFQ